MVPVREELPVAAPLSQVWPLLGDPAAVASCIPGAQLAPDKGDGVWRGSVRVKFGPTAAIFRGEAKLSFDDDAKRCRIEARGIDQRGASRALANFDITASGADTTTLNIEGSFGVTGPLETFANAGGIHVMRALLAEFSNNIAALVGKRSAEGESGGEAGGEAQGEAESKVEVENVALGEPAVPAAESLVLPAGAAPRPSFTGADRCEVAGESAVSATSPAPAASSAPPGRAAPSRPVASIGQAAPIRPRPAAAPRELSAGRLLWLTLASWLRNLLGKRKT
jgi:carbon monoxide dehydrogenase subunit G